LAHPAAPPGHPDPVGGARSDRAGGCPLPLVRVGLRERRARHPGPWDAPRNLLAVGPYRWVRNPIYIAALAVILGEAWLFLSEPLLVYAGEAAIVCHLFVIGYEERTLRRRFGKDYLAYTGTVNRWIPRRPKAETGREVTLR
jgi:protein-S-isoprenylcysteine O-methyltransferase Ste14